MILLNIINTIITKISNVILIVEGFFDGNFLINI